MKQLITLISALFFLTIGVSQVWALPNCVGQRSIAWQNCFGTYTFSNGDKYVGEFKDDKRTGQGTYTFADGDKYVGDFKDSKKHGQGTYTFADGDKYVGEYKDDKLHGQGTYTWAEGEKYVGEYKDDKKNEQSTYTLANRMVKKGIWEDYKLQYSKNSQCGGARGPIATSTSSCCKDTHSRQWNNLCAIWKWACDFKLDTKYIFDKYGSIPEIQT